MDKRFGKYKTKGWVGTAIKPDIPPEDDDDDEEDDEEDDDGEDVRTIDNGRNVKPMDTKKKVLTVEYGGSEESKM
jgi:hypothetical protein